MQIRLNTHSDSLLLELPATSAAEIERIFRQLRYKGHRATVKAILSQYKATKPGFYQAWILLTEYPDYYLESVEIINGVKCFGMKIKQTQREVKNGY